MPVRALLAAALLAGATVGYLLSGRADPPVSHLIFVPSVLLVGVALGFVLGGRAARDALAAKERAEEAKARRRAAREGKAGE